MPSGFRVSGIHFPAAPPTLELRSPAHEDDLPAGLILHPGEHLSPIVDPLNGPRVPGCSSHRFDAKSNRMVSALRKEGATLDDMGLLRTTIEVQNLDRRGPARSLPDTLVDTGSEYTWIPRDMLEGLGIIVERKQGFIVADGRRIDRDVGYALIRAGGSEAPELVVFAEPGDMSLLGAHALEGLNVKIDPVRKALVPAGPVITAGAA